MTGIRIKDWRHCHGYQIARRRFAGVDYWYIERPATWRDRQRARQAPAAPTAPGFASEDEARQEVGRLVALMGLGPRERKAS